MSNDSKKTPYVAAVLEFKSSTFSVPVLVLSSNDLTAISDQLNKKIKLAPEFFKHSPVVFDLNEINKQKLTIDVGALIALMRNAKLLPIGIRSGNSDQIEAARLENVPVYSTNNNVATETPKTKKAEPTPEPIPTPSATLITQPIRSGQRIYAPGDLIVTAQVSAGAEIMAEGNIHIYNSLRGRALAGVKGDTNACIFCFDLQAELISIAGNYKISEDLSKELANKPVQISLKEHTLIIKDLI